MKKWKICSIGDQITLQRGVDITQKDAHMGKIPVISSGGISFFHDTAIDDGPGVIIGRKGSLGTVYWSPAPYWPHDTTLWVKDFKSNNRRFVYYFMKTLKTKDLDVGSSNPTLNRNHVHPLSVIWPPFKEQEKISEILSLLDDKIDLNRGMNETLEAMARALFRDWFVDFGPTRAKMAGEAPYLAPELWELFPDRLDDEGKPEGWHISSIGDETDIVGGSTPSTSNSIFWNGNHYWATPKDLSGLNSPVLSDTSRKITDEGLTQISSGLLPSGSVLLSSRAPVGYTAITTVPLAINQGFIGVKCTQSLSAPYVLLWMKESMELILQNANGSTFQEISKKNFRPLPIIKASHDLLKAFDTQSQGIFDKIIVSDAESRTLAQLRDLLLPKLMSGEISIRDAEKMVEDAA
ncbi:restriction endonuclease subunit S [Acetobacter pasteurianus]|uniref:restriction endonuclease subunit S n=1 Tax=Acetobacter pasteurianus TaxID=438 RepID=UPI000F58217A|nr:restriction endonuclease subunit S [Acetobacter pasteurianus]GCD57246.1 type I DNA specificity S subunit [Acetobacter pasteurianus NBRC 3222]